jgi:hypothetical protein
LDNPRHPTADSATYSIRRYLAQFRRQIRWWLAVDGLARLLIALSLILITSLVLDYAIDRWGPWDRSVRKLISVVELGLVVLSILVLLIGRLARLPKDLPLARWLESQNPALAGRLITSLEGNDHSKYSPELVAEAGRQAFVLLDPIPASRFLEPARPLKKLALGLTILACLASLPIFFPVVAQTWWSRVAFGTDREYPRWTQLAWADAPTAAPPTTKIGRGRDWEAVIDIRPGTIDPGQVRLSIRQEGSTDRRPVLMTSTQPGRYRSLIRQRSASFEILARAGDARTSWRRIEVVDPPVVSQATLEVQPPPYTRQGPTQISLMGSAIAVPDRSTVTLRLQSSKPLLRAAAHKSNVPIETKSTRSDRIELTTLIDQPGSLNVEWTDTDGIDLNEPFRVDLTTTIDRPPTVSASLVSSSPVITPRAIVPLRIQAEDDFGLGNVTIQASSGSRVLLERAPIDGEPPWGKRIDQVQRLDSASWSLQPGNTVSLRLDANDENDLTGPGRASSEEIRLEVVTPEEWLSRLAARELQLRQRMEQVLGELLEARSALDRAAQQTDADPASQTARRLAADRARSTLRKDLGESQAIGLAFADMASDIENNRLDSASLLQRIRQNIVEPIERWVTDPFPLVLADLEQLPDPPNREALAAPIPALDQLIEQGSRILAAMRKLESFQEAVSLLRSIIDDQNALRQATEQKEKQRAIDILKD